MVSPICRVTKIVLSRHGEQKRDSEWISDQFLILRPTSRIPFLHLRFAFRRKAAPCNPRVYLANVIRECNGVICGGRECVNWAQTAIQYPTRKPLPVGLGKKLSLSESLLFIFRGLPISWLQLDMPAEQRRYPGKAERCFVVQPSWGQREPAPFQDSVPLPGSQLSGQLSGP